MQSPREVKSSRGSRVADRDSLSHLQRVVQGRTGWVQCEVLEGLDPWPAPACLLGPLHHQHVVCECLSKQQWLAGGWLLLWLSGHLNLEVYSLRGNNHTA